MKEKTEKPAEAGNPTTAVPPLRIKILTDTVCRLANGDLAEVKKDQVVEAFEPEGRYLIRVGKAEAA